MAVALPAGMRASAYDDATARLWILSRTAEEGVVLQAVDPARGTIVDSVRIPGSAASWIRGSVVIHDGSVVVGWGTTLASYEPGSGRVEVHPAPWKDAGDGMRGRLVDMTSDGSCVVVAVVGEPSFFCWSTATSTWSPYDDGTKAGPSLGTRLAFCAGHVMANLGGSSALDPAPAAGAVWLIPEDTIGFADAAGSCHVVGPTTITSGTPGAMTSTISYAGTSAPVWSNPEAWTPHGLAFVRESVGAVSLVTVDLADPGDEVVRPFPLRSLESVGHGTPVASSFADPCLATLESSSVGDLWAVSCLAGDAAGAAGGYPALWSARS